MKMLTLHALVGFPVYVRADAIQCVRQARRLGFWEATGSDVDFTDGSERTFAETPEEIIEMLNEAT